MYPRIGQWGRLHQECGLKLACCLKVLERGPPQEEEDGAAVAVAGLDGAVAAEGLVAGVGAAEGVAVVEGVLGDQAAGLSGRHTLCLLKLLHRGTRYRELEDNNSGELNGRGDGCAGVAARLVAALQWCRVIAGYRLKYVYQCTVHLLRFQTPPPPGVSPGTLTWLVSLDSV